ncbi:MAG: enoyl-CoA hydratase/isomerase family protein, partial [Terriglobales bacterium]
MTDLFFRSERGGGVRVLRLISDDGTNRLTLASVKALTEMLLVLTKVPEPLIVAGNEKCFSVGADLREIRALDGVAARDFSNRGQQLMSAICSFPAPVYAAISGYCMGGGLDLALACHRRIAAPNAILGHRGASLGLITGWGGTQRLPMLIGKAQSLSMFISAKKIHAAEALQLGLLDGVAEDPVADAAHRIQSAS